MPSLSLPRDRGMMRQGTSQPRTRMILVPGACGLWTVHLAHFDKGNTPQRPIERGRGICHHTSWAPKPTPQYTTMWFLRGPAAVPARRLSPTSHYTRPYYNLNITSVLASAGRRVGKSTNLPGPQGSQRLGARRRKRPQARANGPTNVELLV